MHYLNLKVITPKKVALKDKILSVTVPTIDGQVTILPRHMNLFSLLDEGLIKVKTQKEDEFLAIGGGYLETNGDEVYILVSRAYGQDKINRRSTEKAIEQAEKILKRSKDQREIAEASKILKRSFIDLKLLNIKRKRRKI